MEHTEARLPAGSTAHTEQIVPLRHPWRWLGAAVLLAIVASFAHLLVTNQNFHWNVVAQYLLDPSVIRGLGLTLLLTFLAMAIGLVFGTLLAIMRLSENPLFRTAAWIYIWFFRGVPPLVQLIFWYSLASLLPKISLGIPFGPTFVEWDTNSLITPFSAAILGLSLCEAAYLAEIIRAGIQAVDRGQSEAASALGLTPAQTLRRIVLPQAIRIVVPPIANDTIAMLKFTSLVSVLALPELLYSVQIIYTRTYQTIPMLIVATIWYLILTTILTWFENYLNRRLSRSIAQPESAWSLLTKAMRLPKKTGKVAA